MEKYMLIWVTDIGSAGCDQGRYFESVDAAKADATPGVTWTRYGREWKSSTSRYGDVFFVKPVR